jgi:hypothetical protein
LDSIDRHDDIDNGVSNHPARASMLSLVRSAGKLTPNHLIRSQIRQLRPTARYVSDTGLGGFGALSVPIPLKSNNEIALGQTPNQLGNRSPRARRRRQRESLVSRTAQPTDQSKRPAKESSDQGKGKGNVNWKEKGDQKISLLGKTNGPRVKTRGRKADIRVRRAGKAKPITHHTYGMSKEAKVDSGASGQLAGEAKVTGESTKETDFAPEEIEGVFSFWNEE